MSRFKELNRIEAAIKSQNQEDLDWALSYAQVRFKTAAMKEHIKHWQKIINRVSSAITEAEE